MDKKLSLVLICLSLIVGIAVGYEIKGTAFGASAVTRFKDRIDSTVGFSVNGTTVVNSSAQVTANVNSNTNNVTAGSYNSGLTIITGSGTTTVLTAAQLCNNGRVQWNAVTQAATATMPSAVSLQAACLGTIGGVKYVSIENTGTGTINLVANGSTTLRLLIASTTANSTTTIAGSGTANVNLWSVTSTQSTSNMVEGDVSFFK